MKMTREKVYAAIDSERAYQDYHTRSEERPDMIEIDIAAVLLAMEHQLAIARRAWYSGHAPHTPTMDCLRKVAGLAVKAGEQLGMPQRAGFPR